MARRAGHGRGEDAASPRRIDAAERRAKALDLRKAGATYDQIAQQLGFSNRGNAQRAVQTALKEITADGARDVLTLELERLDAMLLGLWQQARKGNLGAVDRALRIQDRRARYLGLDNMSDDSVGDAKSMLGALGEALQVAADNLNGTDDASHA